MSEACSNFAQHAWKPAFCANCLKPKSRHLGPVPARRITANTKPLTTSPGLATEFRNNGNTRFETTGGVASPARTTTKPRPGAKPSLSRQESDDDILVVRKTTNKNGTIDSCSSLTSSFLAGLSHKNEEDSDTNSPELSRRQAVVVSDEDTDGESFKTPSSSQDNSGEKSSLLAEIESMLETTGSHYYHKYDLTMKGKSGRPRGSPGSAERRDKEAKQRVKAIEEFKKQRASGCDVIDISTEHIAMPYTFVDVANIPLSPSKIDSPPKLPSVESPLTGRRLSDKLGTMSPSTQRRGGSPVPSSPKPATRAAPIEKPKRTSSLVKPPEPAAPTPTSKPFSMPLQVDHAYEPMDCDFDDEEEGMVMRSIHLDKGQTIDDVPTTFTRLTPARASAMTAEFEAKITAAVNSNVEKNKNSTKTLDALNVDSSASQKKEETKADKSKKANKGFFRKFFSFGGKESSEDEPGTSVDVKESIPEAKPEEADMVRSVQRVESARDSEPSKADIPDIMTRSMSASDRAASPSPSGKLSISDPIVKGGSNVPLATMDDVSPDNTLLTGSKDRVSRKEGAAKTTTKPEVKKRPPGEAPKPKPASREQSLRRIKRPPSVPPPVPAVARRDSLGDELNERPPLSPKTDAMLRSVVKTASTDSMQSARSSDSSERDRSPIKPSGSPMASPAGTVGRLEISGPRLERASINLEGACMDMSLSKSDSLGSASISPATVSPRDDYGGSLEDESERSSSRIDTGAEGAVGGVDSGYSGDGSGTGGSSSSGGSLGPRSRSSSEMPSKQGRITRRMLSAPPPPPAPDARRQSMSEPLSSNASANLNMCTLPRKKSEPRDVQLERDMSFDISLPTKAKGGSLIRKPVRRKTLSEGIKFDVEVVDINLKSKKNSMSRTLDRTNKFTQRALPSPPVQEVKVEHEDDDLTDNLYETVSLDDVRPIREQTPYEDVGDTKAKVKPKVKPKVTLMEPPEVPPPIMTNSNEYLTPHLTSDTTSGLSKDVTSTYKKGTSTFTKNKDKLKMEDRMHSDDWRPHPANQPVKSGKSGAANSSESYVLLYENKQIIEDRDRPALSVYEGYHKMAALHQETLHEFMNNIYAEFVTSNGRLHEDLQWSDFTLTMGKRPIHTYSGVAFYQATSPKLNNDPCLLMLSCRAPFQSCVQFSHPNVLSPWAVFQDTIPAEYFPDVKDLDEPSRFRKLRRVTTNIVVMKYTSITNLNYYMTGIVPLQSTDPEDFERLVCYLMDQVINGLLYLQGKACTQYSIDTTDILLLTSKGYREKFVCINPHCIEKQKRTKRSVGENLKHLLFELLQSTVPMADCDLSGCIPLRSSYSRALCKLAQMLTDEADNMLQLARNLLEFVLWGPNEEDLKCLTLAEDRQQAFEVWISLERCRVVTRYALQVMQPRLEEAHHIRFLCSLTGTDLFQITKILHK